MNIYLTPFREGMRDIVSDFNELAGMPCTIGAIDGTHVRITAPKDEEWTYVNRKGEHSINVQVSQYSTFAAISFMYVLGWLIKSGHDKPYSPAWGKQVLTLGKYIFSGHLPWASEFSKYVNLQYTIDWLWASHF